MKNVLLLCIVMIVCGSVTKRPVLEVIQPCSTEIVSRNFFHGKLVHKDTMDRFRRWTEQPIQFRCWLHKGKHTFMCDSTVIEVLIRDKK